MYRCTLTDGALCQQLQDPSSVHTGVLDWSWEHGALTSSHYNSHGSPSTSSCKYTSSTSLASHTGFAWRSQGLCCGGPCRLMKSHCTLARTPLCPACAPRPPAAPACPATGGAARPAPPPPTAARGPLRGSHAGDNTQHGAHSVAPCRQSGSCPQAGAQLHTPVQGLGACRGHVRGGCQCAKQWCDGRPTGSTGGQAVLQTAHLPAH